MRVPFTDLKSHHAPIKEELSRAFREVIESGEFAGGPFVEKFEADFANYCGTKYAVGVGTGTDALWLTMAAMGIGPGDEVITVPMSFIATAEAISFTGAKPVFVDIDPKTYTMDPEMLGKAISRKTRAIVPVHLFGQSADMDPIIRFAKEHGLKVIEDAAQSHGAEYGGRKVGSIGHAGCFSFYPGKNLGAIGEAGMVVTDDEELAGRINLLKDHGQPRKYHHSVIGWNSRMDAIQGAALSIKLRYLDNGNQIRQNIAMRYDQSLAVLDDLIVPLRGDKRTHVFHVYAIQIRNRSRLTTTFNKNGIGYGMHYPVPIHLQPAYRFLGHQRGAFPVSEQCAETFVSLPIYPELDSTQVDIVVGAVNQASETCLTAR
ncbi:MAG: DegT/DnrJ/EryC1/StrS family aminotransferase [Luteolibacter sp.]